MKRKEQKGFLWSVIFFISLALILPACGGGGGGTTSGGTTTPSTTTISGKVSLSSTAGGGTTGLKARPKATLHPMLAKAKGGQLGKAMKGEPGSLGNRLSKVVQRAVSNAPSYLASATVDLYDADHPEWLYSIATATTDANGSFSLSTLTNASKNSEYGATYTDGGSIPAGNYTLIARGKDYSTSAVTTTTYPYYDGDTGMAYRYIVGVQAIIKKFEGAVDFKELTGGDLEVQSSDAVPKVVSIMGKKTDNLTVSSSTTTSTTYDLGTIPANSSIQITFDMSMHRVNTPTKGITLTNADGSVVSGTWKMSPDLKTATFYPSSTLPTASILTLTISSTKTSNYYGKGLKTEIVATYTTGSEDKVKATAVATSPETQTNVPIYSSLKFAANEPLDINSFTVTSSPTIGDKPTVFSLGYKDIKDSAYDYFYQIDTGGAPLKLDTVYDITVSGGKDLAGNEMNSVSFSFQTEATSAGVGTGATADSQAQVKGVLGDWIEAMNSSDLSLFGSMLTGDFSMKFKPSDDMNCKDCPQAYDLNKDKNLSYDEFTKFIDGWFNMNKKIDGWTGTTDGIHLIGDIVSGSEIKVDETTWTAAFGFTMTYTKADGTTYTSTMGPGGVVGPLYCILKKANGAWLLSELSEKDSTSKIDISSLSSITISSPADKAELTQGTKTPTFTWTPVSGVTSYAVVLMDNNDPKGETGWVGIINATSGATTETLAYSTLSDLDGSDGTLVLIGGGKDAPFGKKLTLTDGGSYTWFVAGFKTLTTSAFAKGVEPDSDLTAMSSNISFTIGGTAVSGFKATFQTSTGTPLTFSDTLYAWDAGSSTSARISISGTKSKEVKVYVYGNYYAEYPKQTDASGNASIDIDLYEGYNWIDVTDGINWWYATTDDTKGTSASNYIYTTSGVSYTQLSIESVTAGGTSVSPDTYGYYNLPKDSTATSLTIKGKAASSTVYVYNSSGTAYTSSSVLVNKETGEYETTVDIFAGYNWITLDDGFGNWAYVNVYNLGASATISTTEYISDIKVKDSSGVESTFDSAAQKYPVNTTSVTIIGKLTNSGNGYWYAWGTKNYESGTLWRKTDGTFEFWIKVDNGDNYVYIYDSSWNYKYITINNESTTASTSQPNTIKEIGTMDHSTDDPYSYHIHDAGSSCSITIKGSAPASSGKDIYLYLSNYSGTTSAYDYKTTKADTSGNYSFMLDIYNGTNYIDIYDSNWNWQGAKVTTIGSCSATVLAFDISEVWDTAKLTPDSSNYYNTSASQVTIKGKAKSGKTVTAYVSGTYYNTYTTTALSGDTYSLVVDIFSGYSYISVSDGSNWKYITVKTTGGATYTALTANVWAGGETALGLTSGWYYDAGSTSQVTIKGEAKAGSTVTISVSGSYYNTYTTTADSTKQYSIIVDIYTGWNYLSVSDGSNYLYPTIYTKGGVTSYKNPINNVKVEGLAASSGGTDSDSWGNWSVDKSSVTITGNAKDGTGYWYLYGGSTYLSGSLEIKGGVFSLPVSLDSGYNYVYLYDANWNYYSLTINNTGTVTTVTFTADVYVSGVKHDLPFDSWYHDVGTASQVTIKGASKSGKTVTVYVYGTYTYTYTTTADTIDMYSVTVDLSNGYNYIYVTDGSNWLYPTVSTSLSSVTYKAPINNVKVDGVACSGCDDSSTSGSWSISKTGITISGNASASGSGYWYHYNSSWSMKASGTLNISSGTFSFPLDLDSGYNYIYLYDSKWNSYYMTIYTSGSSVTVTFNTFVYDSAGTTALTLTSGWYYNAGSASQVTIKGDAKSGKTVTIYLSNYDTSPSTYKTYTTTADAANKFSVLIDIFNKYNYLSVTDGSNYQYPTVYTTGSSTVKAPVYGVKVDGTACSGCTDSSTSGSWSISSSSVTVSGNVTASGNGYWYHYDKDWNYKGYGTLSITGGIFSFPLDLVSGNNYVYLYDSQWNYFYATINTIGGVTAVTFNTFVWDAAGTSEISLTSGWYYNAGSASQVTIKGDAKSGKTVTIYLSNYDTSPSTYKTYTATADAANKFSAVIDIFKGYNYLSVTDGYYYQYPTVYTTGGSTVKAPVYGVKVDGTGCSGCTDSSTSGSWSISSSSVTITGNVSASGNGYWYHYDKDWNYRGYGTLSITSGTFSLPLDLGNGNNYVYLYDSLWNYFYATINTSGGTVAKKIVEITSPKHGDIKSGTITVTGTIDKSKFPPAHIYGYVYDYSTYIYKYYSLNVSTGVVEYTGDTLITYDSATGSFSFNASIGGTSNYTNISVYVYDSSWNSHGHSIYVNNLYNYSEDSYKPSSSDSDNANAARAQAHLTEFHKRMQEQRGQ